MTPNPSIRVIAFTVILSLQLIACTKTVQWDEEVPLNTGETIFVKRSVNYRLRGGAGNPMDIRYRPDRIEVLHFEWDGKRFEYEGDADLMLLAISPNKTPVLVAPAANKSWDWKHDYRCAVPHYVQFVPDASGRNWTWPTQIEPWLYGLSHNLMKQRRKPEQMNSRYSTRQRNAEDENIMIESKYVDPKYTVNDCKKM